MTKKYNSPMLQIVGISKSDIIVTSPGSTNDEYHALWETLAPGQRGLDDYYEGY